MLSSIIITSLVVFALTLLLAKSKIFACKREFVKKRYAASKVADKPNFIHIWFHAMWTCPMCSGFWLALPICLFFCEANWIVSVLAVFGLNWLWHCLENVLFNLGEILEGEIEKEK